jgi:replicative DNA helicase
MSADQLATRILSDAAGVASSGIRRGQLEDFELERLKEARDRLKSIKLSIDDTPGMTVAQIRSRARRLQRERGLDLLVVDYLQLMQSSKARFGNRVAEISEISMGLKAVAKELQVPVLALSQLESREDKRPMLSDLRESGSIEQDADIVTFVYRHEYYVRMNEPDIHSDDHILWMSELEACQDKAEVIISKQRHGPTGTVELQFNSTLTKFSDLPS